MPGPGSTRELSHWLEVVRVIEFQAYVLLPSMIEVGSESLTSLEAIVTTLFVAGYVLKRRTEQALSLFR